MADSAIGQDELNTVFWLGVRSYKKKFFMAIKINRLLTKLVRSRWLDIGPKKKNKVTNLAFSSRLVPPLVNSAYILSHIMFRTEVTHSEY